MERSSIEKNHCEGWYRRPSTLSVLETLASILSAVSIVLWIAVLLVGCPKPAKTTVPTYEEARNTALKEAPFIQKPIEERQSLKCDDKAVALKKDEAKGIPHTGVLITNKKAECLVAVKAERNRLRKELSAEKLRARTRQIINDAAIKRLAEEAKPTWWQQHSWKVLAPVLITVGGALVIAVMYALTGGKPITVNSNAIIRK